MSKAKLMAARELIQEKKYDEARIVLKGINHPTAHKWLRRLDEIAPVQTTSRNNRTLLTLSGLVLVLLVIIGGIIISIATTEQNEQSQDTIVLEPTNHSTKGVTTESVLAATPDETKNKIATTLQSFCNGPISILALLNSEGGIPENVYGKHDLSRLQNAEDVIAACTDWVDVTVKSELYNTALFCQRKADEEFRQDLMVECLLERNYLQSFFPNPDFGRTEILNQLFEIFNLRVMSGQISDIAMQRYGI